MSANSNRVLYFAFGSNLLQERIRLRNPSAEYVGVGLLPDYALTFFRVPERYITDENRATWFGGPATIIPKTGADVYGTVWSLDQADIPSLDKQESVDTGLYTPIDPIKVTFVETGEVVDCRTYKGVSETSTKPSPYYLDVILRGAVKSKLPEAYIEKLRKVETNKYDGKCDLYDRVLQMLPEEERNKPECPFLKSKLGH